MTIAEAEALGIAYTCNAGGCRNVHVYFSADNVKFDIVLEMDRHIEQVHPECLENWLKG